jgi:hypothetical protein
MIDANLFCDIIESDKRISYLRQDDVDGVLIRSYDSPNGLVLIDYDDETFNDELGRFYLMQLGLDELVSSVYPKIYYSEDVECNVCLDRGLKLVNEEFVKCDCVVD